MPVNDTLKDLELLIRSRYSLIFLESDEEDRAETLLRHLADQFNLPYFSWTVTKGLCLESNCVYGSSDPSLALGHIESTKMCGIYHFKEFGSFLENKVIVQKLKDVTAVFANQPGAIVVGDEDDLIPNGLKTLSVKVMLPGPSDEDYGSLLDHVLRDFAAKCSVNVGIPPEDRNRILNGMKGLTLMESRKILTKVIIEEGCLNSKNIGKLIEAKKNIVERDGLLEYYPVEESMAQVAGLENLKAWLSKRKEIILDPEKAKAFGLPFPKGVLLLGVQGCGKSLCAKAVAMEWGLPLLRFDPSKLYNKYIGESEKNLDKAMQMAEKMSPIVLWIDEIEKAFSQAGGEEDGGLSIRIFGTFLSWLQDRRGDVFIVATANDISRLPPEFVRKGRFDEIFFVDLPDQEVRKCLVEIHLKKRGKDPSKFDLQGLASATDGFSGAEIEQAVVSGLYTAFSSHGELTNDILLGEIKQTHPLSETMAEKISALRDWVKGRAVRA